jgi:hypothetical protein
MSADKPVIDYVDMTPPAMLRALGDDAHKWADAFCQTMRANNWTIADVDEALMVGWFANAIEHSDYVRNLKRTEVPESRNSVRPWKC